MKRFDDVFGLIKFIHKNKLYPVKKRKIEYGSDYFSDDGYCNTTEDGVDWGQAEGYINEWISKCDESGNILENIKSNDMWNMLTIHRRDYLIDNLVLKS